MLAQAMPPWMTGESHGDDLLVSLVTFSPGDDLTEWWGHTAVVVEDRRLGHARLYNFGMFRFDQGFVGRFIRGRLEFWAADDSVRGTFQLYQRLNRDIRIQELALTGDEAMIVARALGEHVLPQNAMYLYHHYNDNCSTRPRDIIDRAVGGQLKAATAGPGRMTLRELSRRYSMVSPAMSVVLDFLQNDTLDVPITMQQEAFLPDEVERQVQNLQVKHADGTTTPLVKRQYVLFDSRRARPPDKAPNYMPVLLAMGVTIASLTVTLGVMAQRGSTRALRGLGALGMIFGIVFGVFGSALFFLVYFTNHEVTFGNENLLLANPVHWLAVPIGWKYIRRPGSISSVHVKIWGLLAALNGCALGVKVLPQFQQNNFEMIALLLPINAAMALAMTLASRAFSSTADE